MLYNYARGRFLENRRKSDKVRKNGAARILAVLYTIYLLDIQRDPAAVAYAEQRDVNDLAVLRVPVDLLKDVTVSDADV